jgi:hypothetical protein
MLRETRAGLHGCAIADAYPTLQIFRQHSGFAGIGYGHFAGHAVGDDTPLEALLTPLSEA